jgi:hypothetical protein
VTMRWYFREHKSYASYNPNMTFNKKDATRPQCTSDSSGYGDLYMIKDFDRTWLNAKKIKITWAADLGYSGSAFKVQIDDGVYDVSSDADFPSGAARPTKGAGTLQTPLSHSGTFAETTETTAALNLSGGNQTRATVLIWVHDAWATQQFRFNVDKIQILDASDNVLLEDDFTAVVTMERTGTTGDYGYISVDQITITGFRIEGHDFEETKF